MPGPIFMTLGVIVAVLGLALAILFGFLLAYPLAWVLKQIDDRNAAFATRRKGGEGGV